MAEFEVKVYELKIEEHPNADAIELARVGDYHSIVRKGDFKTGDLGVYIPEGSIVPDWLIERMGLTGKLAGKDKNRVKAVKLRGVLSQGLVYGLDWNDRPYCLNENDAITVHAGDDVTDFLGITKWEPPIPVHMAGEVFNAHGKTLKYDIENIKKYPDVFEHGEEVVATEKIHGTWACFGYHPAVGIIITSKGLSASGLAFKLDTVRNDNNLYVKTFRAQTDADCTIIGRAKRVFGDEEPFYILGEIYGTNVQDLSYGATIPDFRVFDIFVGSPNTGRFLDYASLVGTCTAINARRVPDLGRFAFTKSRILDLTSGRETVSGTEANLREGIVIKPVRERRHDELGRVILKSVSEAYLTRKGKTTEYN